MLVVSWMCSRYQFLEEGRDCLLNCTLFQFLRRLSLCTLCKLLEVGMWLSSWGILFWRYSLCAFPKEGRWLSSGGVFYVIYLRKAGVCLLLIFSVCSWRKVGGCCLEVYSMSFTWGRLVFVFYGYSLCAFLKEGRSVVVLWRCTLCHLLEISWCLSSVDILYVCSLRKVGGCLLEVYSMSYTWRRLVFVFCGYSLCVFLKEGRWLSSGGVLYVIYLR